MKKLTPILYVEEIEPVLPFWIDGLGFELAVEVPEEDRLGFVILQKDGIEIMYQTKASIANDIPELAGKPMRGSFLFIEVDDVDEVEKRIASAPRVVPRRRTSYGADELIVREPAGNTVTFAAFPNE